MAAVNLTLQKKKTETQRGYMARIRSGIQSQVWLIPKSINSFLFLKLSPEYYLIIIHLLCVFYLEHILTRNFKNLILSAANILSLPHLKSSFLLMLYVIQHYEN